MTRFENPILKFELRSKLRAAKFIPAMLLRCVCLALMFFLILLAYLGRGILAFVLAESLLILLFTPGIVYSTFSSQNERRNFNELILTQLSSPAILLGKLVTADIYTLIIIVISGIAMCIMGIFRSELQIWRLICVNISLLILVFLSSMIGLIFSMMFRRNTSTGGILAYMLVFLLIGSAIIPSPLIERLQSNEAKTVIINVVLYVNPLIMVSRALTTIDLMRTRYIYDLADPIVNRGFSYPDWYLTGAIYLGISLLLFVPALIRFKYMIKSPLSFLQDARTG